MKIIHTSDWHLGNRLMDSSRKDEFNAFIEHMLHIVAEEKPDALLLAGDVFDNTTPSDQIQQLYCDFLSRAHKAGCGTVIVTAGNHDGVTQLGVTRPLLELHHAHVVTNLTVETAADCLVEIPDEGDRPLGLVCAVPFLRVNEVSVKAAVDDEEGRKNSYVNGIKAVYDRVAELAAEWKAAHPGCPVIAMGHLAVGNVPTTDSTRQIIIVTGTLEAVQEGIFSPAFDYVALGHIHKGYGNGRIRYCGSPLAMGMDEAAHPHRVLVWEDGAVREIPVPEFTLFRTAQCANRAEVEKLIQSLAAEAGNQGKPVWLLLEYAATDITRTEIEELLKQHAAAIPVYRLKRLAGANENINDLGDSEASLHQLDPREVFARKLQKYVESSPMSEEDQKAVTARFESVFANISTNR